MIKKLGPAEKLRACCEAGPTGYVVYWLLAELGIQCEVVAPTLVPVKARDRVKTDRRDAEKLARCYRSGDLTAVWVPDEGSEALRDLVRAREAAKQDQMRARHRLSKFLLRSAGRSEAMDASLSDLGCTATFCADRTRSHAAGLSARGGAHAGTVARLEQAIMEAVKLASPSLQQVINDLQALRGIADISAVTIAVELARYPALTAPDNWWVIAVLCPVKTPVASESDAGPSLKRQRALATNRGRSSMELSSSTRDLVWIAQTTGERFGRGQGDCLESATPPAQALYETGRCR
jgi:transposase